MTATLPVVDRKARRAAVAGGVGSVVEWYDYGLYGIAAALLTAIGAALGRRDGVPLPPS